MPAKFSRNEFPKLFFKVTKILTFEPENIMYIIFVFGINFPKKYTSVTRKSFSGINFPKITYHVFVCASENCMEK